MNYEWDEAKRQSNLAKHGLDFADMVRFDWDGALYQGEDILPPDIRIKEIGRLDDRIIAIVYVERNGVVRMISMRAATKFERRMYDQ